MNKVAHYLQEHLLGEVTDSPEVRRYFSQDASVLRLAPAIVVYPRNEQDIRKTCSFSWQLAQRGQTMPITARGAGSDTSGAAIGAGIMLAFTAHMNKILNIEGKKKEIIVEPGATYDKIEQTLFTHGYFLPPYPASQNYATIGGGIANNSLGEKSVKYGVTGKWVRTLRVVLANGEVIETGPLTKRELSHKLGLSTFEGEIYRALDKLLEENAAPIEEAHRKFAALINSSGYNIFKVRGKSGFDLTPLIVGSQGSLGIISEATMRTEPHNPQTSLCLASLPQLGRLTEIAPQIMKLKPSVFDMINRPAIELITQINPNQLNAVIPEPAADMQLIIEFDEFKDGEQRKAVKALTKIIERAGGQVSVAVELEDQDIIRKLRDSVSSILNFSRGQAKAVPVAEDVSVPTDKLVEFLSQSYQIYDSVGLPPAAWGHVGLGVVRFQPLLDLSNLGDRQKLFKISDSLYGLAVSLGGSVTGGAGDGRVRAPYLALQYGEPVKRVMDEVKRIFDPYNILNPGVKSASPAEIKALMRGDYGLSQHHAHLPRS